VTGRPSASQTTMALDRPLDGARPPRRGARTARACTGPT
jgi:hypothetical protein